MLALSGAVGLAMPGCGRGLFTEYATPADAGTETSDTLPAPADDGPSPVPGSDAVPVPDADALPPDLVGNQVSQKVDQNGATLQLDGAVLVIGPGTFAAPTLVTLREVGTIDYAGAYGSVFEIRVPDPNLVHQDFKLTLPTPALGPPNQANLVIGKLDPSNSLDKQQWIAVSGSSLNSDQTSATVQISDLAHFAVFQYAIVLGCNTTSVCRSGEACNSGACQQCPTSSVCAP